MKTLHLPRKQTGPTIEQQFWSKWGAALNTRQLDAVYSRLGNSVEAIGKVTLVVEVRGGRVEEIEVSGP